MPTLESGTSSFYPAWLAGRNFWSRSLATVVLMLTMVTLLTVLTLGVRSATRRMAAMADTSIGSQPVEATETDIAAFTAALQQDYPASFRLQQNGAYAAVLLHPKVLYRVQEKTSFQELAITDSSLVMPLTQQLDAQGIEYEVLKNTGDTFLKARGEWLVSWGGVLYKPRVPAI